MKKISSFPKILNIKVCKICTFEECRKDIEQVLDHFNIGELNQGTYLGTQVVDTTSYGNTVDSYSPVDGMHIGSVSYGGEKEYEFVMEGTQEAFKEWRMWPAPKRGEIVRQFACALRENKEPLGKLVTYEMGKSLQEGLGEVQEMIDICDFAVGLSRQLHGFTMHSERKEHRMYEQYHPLGILGLITSFNFPVAPWCWNSALAWVCGDCVVWKPSHKTPITAVACQKIANEVFEASGVPDGVSSLLIGGGYGQMLAEDGRVPLISATGSTAMGKKVGAVVGGRLGRSILELGGNNAIIVTPSADLKMVIPGTVFGSVGTTGQRCTSTRRLIIHEDIYDEVKNALLQAYGQVKIGNPMDMENHTGPMIDTGAVQDYLNALERVKEEGGNVLIEGKVLEGFESGCYVQPVLVEAKNEYEIVQEETFAPILYLIKYSGGVENAIAIQNGVPQGLSSSIMTNSLKDSEKFLSHCGSDCGIANCNIGTSGAEIGGAFGGEKETGGGRESGSDVWKYYMRRQTNTINWSDELPLAQGIEFNF